MKLSKLLSHWCASVPIVLFAVLLLTHAQPVSAQDLQPFEAPSQDVAALNLQPQQRSDTTSDVPVQKDDAGDAKQSKRILWIFPNYRAVGTNTQLPRLSLREKFWLATQDSFDYSSFVSSGIISGVSQARNSYPEFGSGGAAFGRYYWHAVADQAVGNYMTEAIVPALTHEDPRYLHTRTRRLSQAHRLCGKPVARHAHRFRPSHL